MPDHDEKLCGDSPKVVNLNASSESFALLLNLIDHRPVAMSYSWPELGKVMQLGNKYQFFLVCRLVIGQVDNHPPKGNPWTVFALASQLNLLALAKSAIGDLGASRIWYADERGVRAKDMAGVTGVYTAALLRAIDLNVAAEMEYVRNPSGGNRKIRGTNWAGVSKDFDLRK